MRNKQTISNAKLEANQANALKSTGPKTSRGKRFSRRNSLRHGFYSKELHISDADRPEFEELRRLLELEFKPATAMQALAFDSIVAWAWRAKLGTRLEHGQLARIFEASDACHGETANPIADLHLSRWYGSSRQSIRAGIKGLDYARGEFKNLGYFRGETKEYLSRVFGPDFVETLTRWTPMLRDAVLLANMLVTHAKNFGETLDPFGAPPPDMVLDPQQAFEMVGKLIDERRHYMEEMLKIMDQNLSDAERNRGRSDFNPGFLAAANRELRRAVDWFLYLKEMGL